MILCLVLPQNQGQTFCEIKIYANLSLLTVKMSQIKWHFTTVFLAHQAFKQE